MQNEDEKEQPNNLLGLTEVEEVETHFHQNFTKIKSILSDSSSDIESSSFLISVSSIAHYARYESIRDKIKTEFQDLLQILCQALCNDASMQPDLKIQLIRSIGNLVIDDDSYREQVLASGTTKYVLNILAQSNRSQEIKVETGFLLNVSMKHIKSVDQIIELGGVQSIFEKCLVADNILGEDDSIVYLALRLISNLFDTAQGQKASFTPFFTVSNLCKLLNLYNTRDTRFRIENLDYIVEFLELALTENESYQSEIVNTNLFSNFLNFYQKWSKNLLEQDPKDEEVKEWLSILTVLERSIVLITSCDDNLKLFDDKHFVDLSLTWLQSNDHRLTSCAALMLGNLARTEQNCVQLVQQHDILKIIKSGLMTLEDLAVKHGLTGLLKNLIMPMGHRELIGQQGFIEIIAPLLDKDTAPPLQQQVAGTLKLLTAKHASNVELVCTVTGADVPLQKLTRVSNKSDDVSIKAESTRAIANVVRHVYNQADLLAKYYSLLVELEVLNPVLNMVGQKDYPLLQSEAIMALALVAGNNTNDNSILLQLVFNRILLVKVGTDVTHPSLLHDLLAIVKDKDTTKYPVQVKINVITTLINLIIKTPSQEVKLRLADQCNSELAQLILDLEAREKGDAMEQDLLDKCKIVLKLLTS